MKRVALFTTMGIALLGACADIIGIDHLKDWEPPIFEADSGSDAARTDANVPDTAPAADGPLSPDTPNTGDVGDGPIVPDAPPLNDAPAGAPDGPLDARNPDACRDPGGCLPTPPSCTGLPTSCGGADSCCATIHVPGGTFSRGYDQSNADAQDGHKVFGWKNRGLAIAVVSDFWLDKYEVTVGRFRNFVESYDDWIRAGNPQDGRGAHYNLPGGTGWKLKEWAPFMPKSADEIRTNLTTASTCGDIYQSWSNTVGNREDLPINCLSWYEAFLFCIWDGGRLPTDAEWNYAAAGGDQQRAFPWSTPADDRTIVSTDAVFGRETARLNLANAGSISGRDARWGHRDLAGNSWEWVFDACQDCQGPTFETPELSTYLSTCNDCVSLLGDRRFFRGGSWKYPSHTVRTAFRAGTSPEVRYDDLGVRCARNPP